MTNEQNLKAALELAAAGLPVFPVRITYNPVTRKFNKQPCITGWQTKATANEAAVRQFWDLFPYAVPGAALGRSGLVVLDADRHGGPDGVSAFHELAARYGLPKGVIRIKTAGSGEHWVFRNLANDPLGNGEGVLPGGINMRGHGGFIVAPGSVRPDGERWREPDGGLRLGSSFVAGTIPEIPHWLVDLIRSHKALDRELPNDQPIQPEQPAVTERERSYAARALECECTRVRQAARGTRNEILNKAAFALGRMAGAGWIEPDLVHSSLFTAAQDCSLVRDDGASAARKTTDSGLAAGMSEPRAPLPDRGFGTIGTIGTRAESVWSEPELSYLGSGRSQPVPFPVELLGSSWGNWCQAHAQARCVPVDYVAAGLLASASALIGNARWAMAGPEWREPSVLWLTVVGSPSAGKSPGLDPVLAIIRQIERSAIEALRPEREAYHEALELARARQADWQAKVREALKKDDVPLARPADAVEPEPVPLPRLMVGDTTPEKLGTILRDNPKGVLLNRDEIAGWLGSFGRYSSAGGGERAMWLEAYGGRVYTIDRQKDPEPIIIPHLSVPVLGGAQPDKLRLITGGDDDGFAARILWCWPEPVSGFRLARAPVDGKAQEEALRRLHGLAMTQGEHGTMQPSHVPVSDTAAAHFEAYGSEVKVRANGASGLLAGALGKATGQVLRLALVLEYLGWCEATFRTEPSKIGETAMLSAIGLIDGYFLPMARRVFGEAAIPEEERRAMELARWISEMRPERFNARKVRRQIGGLLREAKHMAQACEVLVQAEWIRPVAVSSASSGGRAPSDYEVNPSLLARAEVA
ncbi:DUF3987 domain-containing protein [Microvirga aerophila]|uniref:DNA primase/polymerase bifunctional N-terminal domain-containing protein n=1 Tax=Microvirga aerophila TaxID=670291 RepID=A0A512C3A7_9HYPH|nr:DUF3987 domain-containing protein [Microvirga aerophila]GEO18686.1 hypothetical protein MAE02_63820 [Microvirga aerophila]